MRRFPSSKGQRHDTQEQLTDEHTRWVANHPLTGTCRESPRATKLYDRTHDVISLDEIQRILMGFQRRLAIY